MPPTRPTTVITEAADLIEEVSALLAPYDADEWTTPSGRRMDLPNRGNILQVPDGSEGPTTNEIGGVVRFRRFHLGRNGAVHGGALAQLFDSVLGFAAFRLTRSPYAAHRLPARELPQDRAHREGAAGRRPVWTAPRGARSSSPGDCSTGMPCSADAEALFVKLNPGQP